MSSPKMLVPDRAHPTINPDKGRLSAGADQPPAGDQLLKHRVLLAKCPGDCEVSDQLGLPLSSHRDRKT